jgi:hypothetical protein
VITVTVRPRLEQMRKELFKAGVKSIDSKPDYQVAAIYQRYLAAGKLNKEQK